jgi:alpha-D-xyloside xylohydrolase
MARFFFFSLFLMMIVACAEKNYMVSENSLVLYPVENTQKGAVRITVIQDDIIKVEISATRHLDTTKSLIALENGYNSAFKVDEKEDHLVLSTPKLKVNVSKNSGAVSFSDVNGKIILAEIADTGDNFAPVTIDDVGGYKVHQQFDSPENEALYGLGQHQAGEINYKGKNEELFQYNTKVSVPFIVSTRNYGILWDNYSLTRFGDPRPYSNLDQFILYDKNGGRGGLTATYVDNRQSGHVYTERKEQTIDYENLEMIRNFPEKFDFTEAIITWEGDLEASESGIYRFLCYYAGYTKLWIDGELQFDKWRTAWNPSVAKFDVDMAERGKTSYQT